MALKLGQQLIAGFLVERMSEGVYSIGLKGMYVGSAFVNKTANGYVCTLVLAGFPMIVATAVNALAALQKVLKEYREHPKSN